MNQQYPPQQPGWGQQPHQPYPQQPGWVAPPPPPKKTPVGMIVGLGCLGIVVLFILLGVVGTIAGGDSSDTSKGTSTSVDSDANKDTQAEKKDDAPAAEEEPAEEPTEEAAPESPIKIVAKKTAFSASVLADGSNYTSIKVTVTNNSDDTISVNPLYFSITDTNGTKHASELAADNNQIDTVDLAPGENVSGTVTGKGKFTAKTVTYTDGFIGDTIITKVS